MVGVSRRAGLMSASATERGLRRLFTSLGWTSQHDVPMCGTALVRVGSEAPVEVNFFNGINTIDGVQTWVNPEC